MLESSGMADLPGKMPLRQGNEELHIHSKLRVRLYLERVALLVY
jgi:hypothetical protein